MRSPERPALEIECPTRYILDEARFAPGQDRVRANDLPDLKPSKEVIFNEPPAGHP